MPTQAQQTCDLIRLFHHRWTVPVLAAFNDRGGLRFVEIYHGLGIRRESAAAALDALIDLGLVARNPGYGHPLRPEYVLVGRGGRLAAACRRFDALVERAGLTDLAYRKWSMPVLQQVARGQERFGVLSECLPGITPRALAAALKALEEGGLVKRTVSENRPPAPRYRPTASGGRLVRALPRCAIDMMRKPGASDDRAP